MNPFVAHQRLWQGEYLKAAFPDRAGHKGADYRLSTADRLFNVAPAIREQAETYFADKVWHIHASHGLSSQACCLNFLMPLATRKDMLSGLLASVLGEPPLEVLKVEDGPDGKDWYVGFEWNGRAGANYLNEGKDGEPLKRGANSTCADAIVRFRSELGDEALLVEWKYTEVYGAPLSNKARAGALRTPNEVRTERYQDLAFAPAGPIRTDKGLKLSDFFYEPFYQLLRQQMLAAKMEADPNDPAKRVRVLHISPTGNQALHKVTSEAFRDLGFNDAFDAFKAVIQPQPDGVDRFIGRSTEQVFGALIAQNPDDPWASYLTARYTFLSEDAA